MVFLPNIYEYLNIVSINRIEINRNKFTIPFNPGFFILLIVKSFETLPKHSV